MFRAEKQESGKITPTLDFATKYLSDLDHIKQNLILASDMLYKGLKLPFRDPLCSDVTMAPWLASCHPRGTEKEIYLHNGKEPLRMVKKHGF